MDKPSPTLLRLRALVYPERALMAFDTQSECDEAAARLLAEQKDAQQVLPGTELQHLSAGHRMRNKAGGEVFFATAVNLEQKVRGHRFVFTNLAKESWPPSLRIHLMSPQQIEAASLQEVAAALFEANAADDTATMLHRIDRKLDLLLERLPVPQPATELVVEGVGFTFEDLSEQLRKLERMINERLPERHGL